MMHRNEPPDSGIDLHHTKPARHVQAARRAARTWRALRGLLLATALVAALAALAGCGGGDDEDASSPTTPAPTYVTVPCFIRLEPRTDPITECYQLQTPAPAASAASAS